MRQREVHTPDGTRWTCVQALAGVDGAAADAAAQKLERADGLVAVVCTPSGGAETERVMLESGWEESVSDDALLRAIDEARAR